VSTLLMEVSPAAALGIFTLGLLLIYFELNRPGRVIPGAAGLLLMLLACARLGAAHPGPVALLLVVTAGALLAMELVGGMYGVVAIAAMLALILGFRLLVTPPVGWMVCILCGVGLGGVTTALARVARRARANKANPGAVTCEFEKL
jgi:membrane-bound serine protease (ClpP class)